MTDQEAMEILKKPCLCDYDLSKTIFDCDIEQCDKRDAVLQAIKALEEVQTYRAIGTPEECRAAAETIKSMMERNLTTEIVTEYMKFEDECVKQGFSFNSILEAREKQTAKKPEAIDYKKYVGFVKNAKFLRGAYWCPNCSHVVRSGAYCDDCGQKLDWSDEE